ncbi:conserved hypothetical protein [Talaromyces stipitatus ATCC 10500]|uniref:Uncharacterized protein n=1 Tax=Talaromyces stipitatus (strain ATCC 10500 / CBS 375.48 / QM 6759 / NRRL 1006) TaxID=441959 RepID=B8LW79_TALSN|nr:uncharacterized protein TSTA_074860 [Talaromyces stipitatus ATCC 10500]EED24107.1 conserved hypothetical protein [Talaromyces stipitatus ATCC 10500]
MEYLQDNILPSLRTYSILLFRKTFSTITSPKEADQLLSNLQQDYLEPYLIMPLANILDSSSAAFSSANILSFLTLLVTFYISLRVLDYARRVIMFWVILILRLTFWAAVISIGVYVYNVGVDKATQDAGWFWGIAQGFLEDLVANNANTESTAGRQYYGGSGGGSRGYGIKGSAGRSSGYWHNSNRRA